MNEFSQPSVHFVFVLSVEVLLPKVQILACEFCLNHKKVFNTQNFPWSMLLSTTEVALKC